MCFVFWCDCDPELYKYECIMFECSMTELIVKAAVKDALEGQNVSSDFYDALDEEVQGLLDDASDRAEANDRKTVQSRDL